MNYLVTQILVYLLAAAALGFVLGWLTLRFVVKGGDRSLAAHRSRQLADVRKERDLLSIKAEELACQIEDLQGELDSTTSELEELRSPNVSEPVADAAPSLELQELLEGLREQHDELRNQYDQQQNRHDELRQRHDRQRQQYEECIATLENELVEQKRRQAFSTPEPAVASATAFDEGTPDDVERRCQAYEEALERERAEAEALREEFDELRSAHAQLLSMHDRQERQQRGDIAAHVEEVAAVAEDLTEADGEFVWTPKDRIELDDTDKGKVEVKGDAQPQSSPEPQAEYPYPIEEIEGVGKSLGSRLRALGVQSTEDLLKKCGSSDGLGTVAASTGMPVADLHIWTAMADLMRVAGVRRQQSELLHAAGVESVQELATREAEELIQRMKQVNDEQKRMRPVPDPATVTEWIGAAKSLPRMIDV